MERCLDENELAEYADYLCYGAEMPDMLALTHVEHCFHCKQEIMAICDLMADLDTVPERPDLDL